jgi:arsenate reductase
VIEGMNAIPDDRKQEIKKLALYVRTKRASGEIPQLLFICTHNSRRSHLGQIWATVAADYYGIDKVKTFSGGTQATAFNKRAVAAIERAGFKVEKPTGDNPHYKVSFADSQPALECFSKKYDDAVNPHENFAAVMTCANADKNCPVVAGSSLRVPLHYEDPKDADDKPNETAVYDERTKQIATEMFYLFSQVKG